MLGSLLDLLHGIVPPHNILDRLIRSFPSDLGLDLMIRLCPTHLDQPFHKARCDGGSECHPYGKQKSLVNGVCENCLGPDRTALVAGGLGRFIGIFGSLFETDGFAEGRFEGTNVVGAQEVDGEEGERKVDGRGEKVDTERPPAVPAGEELQPLAKRCFGRWRVGVFCFGFGLWWSGGF